ncbi:MOSC domain-containing protein [Shimia marina]|uniref:MOSC domain-containing protein n=1 Tax=Shimia marina TaxID=321267 RepID=A0A0P1ETG5_9RHOB|nr:hypothetical protein [Shimia marina]CUH53744.1 hypothetical protein SHM7688_03204 [Shimia marina]SFD69523.1 hypothetical protein SAMN04488037_10266 [Shimia marina]
MIPSREDLMRALPHVLAAPKDGAAIAHLCLRPARNTREFVDEITLTKAGGIPGERWMTQPWMRTEAGEPHPGIQVCVIPKRVLDLVWAPDEDVLHPGDTFAADLDMTEANLPEGQLLSVGTAVLRVSEVFNDGCVKWKARYGADVYDWVRAPEHRKYRLRSILCSIEQDGVVRSGDVMRKIDQI